MNMNVLRVLTATWRHAMQPMGFALAFPNVVVGQKSRACSPWSAVRSFLLDHCGKSTVNLKQRALTSRVIFEVRANDKQASVPTSRTG